MQRMLSATGSDALSRLVWIRRRYEEVEGIAVPDPIIAHESDVPADPTDTYMEQHLTPYEQLGFDMGINLQTFRPWCVLQLCRGACHGARSVYAVWARSLLAEP